MGTGYRILTGKGTTELERLVQADPGTQLGENSVEERKIAQEGDKGSWGPGWRIGPGLRRSPSLAKGTQTGEAAIL